MSKWVRHKKKDANQPDIVRYLESQGCVVDDVAGLSDLGYDLIVNFAGQAALVEVKDGSKPLGKRKLTESEQRARDRHRKLWFLVESEADCDLMLGVLRGIAR